MAPNGIRYKPVLSSFAIYHGLQTRTSRITGAKSGVVSPLIVIMVDQVTSLRKRGVNCSARVKSIEST